MTTEKQKRLFLFKKRKFNVFILFVVLATLFSLLTKLSKDYTQTVAFQINHINVPEDKVIIKDAIQKLNITLTTYGFKLIRYQLSDQKVDINISKLDNNDDFYFWIEHKEFADIVSQFDPNVKIVNINPDTLKIRYDSNAVKKVPVVLNSNIEFSPGYDESKPFRLEPDSIKAIGPKILIDSINSVQTEVLELLNVNANITSTVKLIKPSNDQVKYSQNSILVQTEVDRFTEGTISVPVIVRNVPENVKLKIYPKSIEVIYYASLSEFKNIRPNSFIVECNYEEALNDDSSFLIPRIIQSPDQVKSARLNLKRIEFFITK